MNAYELAEYLCENTPDGVSYRFAIGNAAIMLRQQADRIAGLEKQLKHYKMAWNMAENELETQTKPLSDADIQQISHRYHYTYNPDYVGFARAIEERHGIK